MLMRPVLGEFPETCLKSTIINDLILEEFLLIIKQTELRKKMLSNNMGFPWKEYLDLDGFEAAKLDIDAFLTNFLLNEKEKLSKRTLNRMN